MWLNLLLINSHSNIFRWGYHGIWMRDPPFLQVSKEPLLHNYVLKLHSPPGHSNSCSIYWYHHHINLLAPIIHSDTKRSLYIGWHATCAATVACLCWIYSWIDHSPSVSSASATGGHSHYPLILHLSIIPVMLITTLWRITSSNFSMAPITTQLFLLYNNTDWKTTFYSIPCARTVDPYSSPPSPPLHTVLAASKYSDTGPPRHYCYRRLCVPDM